MLTIAHWYNYISTSTSKGNIDLAKLVHMFSIIATEGNLKSGKSSVKLHSNHFRGDLENTYIKVST